MLAVSLTVAFTGFAVSPATAGETHVPDAATTHWQLVGPDASGGHLAFTPAAPSELYVLPDSGLRVYRTDDHGQSWTAQGGLGVAGGVGNRLAADPRNADVVYVAVTVPGPWTGNLVRSDDGARTFHSVLDSSAGLADVVVSPTGREVFAAGDAGVFASHDGGRHWARLPGAPAGVSRIALVGSDLVVSAATGMYLVEDALGTPRGVRQLPVPGTFPMTNLSVHGDVVLASSMNGGAVLSTDRGRHWASLRGPWGPTDALTFTGLTATGDLEVQSIAGSADGTGAKNLWVSGNSGRSWSARPGATAKVDVITEIGGFPDRPREQVVAGAAGIYTTHDAVSFQRIGVPAATVNTVAVVGSALVAGTSSGSYRSTAPLRPNLSSSYQDWGPDGEAPPTIGNTITAVTPLPGGSALRVRNTYCAIDCFALERSRDNGLTWQSLTEVDGNAEAIAVDATGRIYVGSYLNDVGVYVSDDGGRNLVLRQPAGLAGVTSLAVDPRAKGALWIGDQSGLFHSTDAGMSASKVIDGEIDAVAVDPADPRHIVAAGTGLIKVSRDGGKTFTDAASTAGLTYDAITFGPGGVVFAGSRDLYEPGQGVLRSTDGGFHWLEVSATLPDQDVRDLVTSPDGRWLFAGTGAGVYRLALN